MAFQNKTALKLQVSESKSAILPSNSSQRGTWPSEHNKTLQLTTFLVLVRKTCMLIVFVVKNTYQLFGGTQTKLFDIRQVTRQFYTKSLILPYCQLSWIHLAWAMHLPHLFHSVYKSNLAAGHYRWAADLCLTCCLLPGHNGWRSLPPHLNLTSNERRVFLEPKSFRQATKHNKWLCGDPEIFWEVLISKRCNVAKEQLTLVYLSDEVPHISTPYRNSCKQCKLALTCQWLRTDWRFLLFLTNIRPAITDFTMNPYHISVADVILVLRICETTESLDKFYILGAERWIIGLRLGEICFSSLWTVFPA